MFTSIETLRVSVLDIDIATQDYTQLFGFEPLYSDIRTTLFDLGNAKLELTVKKNKPEGLFGIGFRPKDFYRCLKLLKAERHGHDAFSRSARIPLTLTRGLPTWLLDSQIKPTLPERPQSSITKLDHVVIRTNDPDGLIGLYQGQFGIRLALDTTVEEWGGRMLFFRLGHATIEAIAFTDDQLKRDSLWGLAWEVDDIEVAHQRLTKKGVEIGVIKNGRKPATRVATVKSHTHGISTLLIEHLKY